MSFVCVYIFKTKNKKNPKKKKKFKISKAFPKKEKIFQMKKIFELRVLNFLMTFSKRPIFFFSFKDFKIKKKKKKVSFSKWYMRILWTKHFLNLDV